LFSSALAFALVNRVLRHRLTYLSAFSVLAALGWGYIFRVIILSRSPFFSVFYVFATLKEKDG
jgi:membrane protein involved in D-alanine export